MLSSSAFHTYADNLKLPQTTLELLKSVRIGPDGNPAPPVRRVESHAGNSNVRYPSQKMGFVVDCESGRSEYYAALHFEHDPDVLEYYSQPATITLHYQSAAGRALTVPHTPDFLVLRLGSVDFVECKSIDGIQKQAQAQPNRYRMTAGDRWTSPPAEEAVRAYGVGYRLWTPSELTPQFAANLRYLDPQYWRREDAYLPGRYSPVVDYVRQHQGVSLDGLVDHFGYDAPSLIRWMIVRGHLFCDLQHQLVSESANLLLYSSPDLVRAAQHFGPGDTPWPIALTASAPEPNQQTSYAISHAYQHFGASAFKTANWRVAALNGAPSPLVVPSERTLRLWKKGLVQAEKLYGVAYLGLLPKTAARGNRKPRYPEAIYALADEIIHESFLVTAGMKRALAYKQFLARCAERHLGPVPSHVWFYQRAAAAADPAHTVLLRQGPRAAYPLLAGTRGRVGAMDVHGDYPLQVVHIDHTQLDIEIVSSTGLNLGRPWLTVAFDATTRLVLGIYLSFDSPSVDSVLMVIRDSVLRHELLPIGITVDNGPEFHSMWFETFTAIYKIVVSRRPPRNARFGCLIENFFGVNNSQLVHALIGNTQLTKNVRQVTKRVNPAGLAIWTLPALYKVLDAYCFDHFNRRPHGDVGQSPADAFNTLILKHGVRALRSYKLDEAFLLATMVGIDGDTARVQPARGIKVRGDYFYHADLDHALGKDVLVRYDPMDPGRVFAEVEGKWVSCLSKFADRVACLTVRQVECWSQELRRRHAAAKDASRPSMLRLGQFIEEIKTQTEGDLRVQYERALANRQVLALRPSLLPAGTPVAPPATPAASAATLALPPGLFAPMLSQPFPTLTLPPSF
jgi:putative transposase